MRLRLLFFAVVLFAFSLMRSEEAAMSQRENSESEFWIRNVTADRKLEDEYLLGDVIGRGSFSIVYKCLRKGRTEWACKILKKKHLNKKAVQTHMRTLLQLKHPNIVHLKEVFETEDELQLILELAGGGELFERIVESGYYSEENAAQAVRHILNALQYLHGNGIIHRDLKPENLLYQTEMENSTLKIANYGMSKLLSEDQVSRSRFSGAFGYNSPEVLLGKEIDSSTDLWSLGVITYIMLCGFEPFWDDSGEAAMSKRITEGDYSFPSPWWDEISDSAKELISQLLSVNPKSRPTAQQALNHPWTQGISTPTLHMNQTVLRLREFNARRRFRVATKAVLATRRALHLLPPTKKSASQDGKTVECFCGEPKDGSTNGDKCEGACRDCSPVDGSGCGDSDKPRVDKDVVKSNAKLASEFASNYKENYVGLG